jgi:ABC-2 type transport system ATP-binding protein
MPMISEAAVNPQVPALTATGVEMLYPKMSQPALSGFTLSVSEGEVFGLLGPNGAGKTTAISILCSLLCPTKGTVSIRGMDVHRHPKRIREWMGIIPQDIALYPTLTARENLRYFGRLYGMRGRALAARIEECLEWVGLTEKGDHLVKTYSGGMKRRANLAAGCLHAPKLLFLDEPTVGIDPQSRNLILERLALLQRTGTTMIYTTHYIEEAECLCSRILILDEGRTIVEGAPKDLIASTPGCASLADVFFALTGKQLRD